MIPDISTWEVHYAGSVPPGDAGLSLLEHLREQAAIDPERAAIAFGKIAVSYGRVAAESRSLAAALVDLGVKCGDRIALVLPLSPQAIIALFAIWAAGAIAVPVSPLLPKRELELSLIAGNSSLAIVFAPFYGKLKEVQVRAAVRRIIVTSISEYLPPLARFLFTLVRERRVRPITGDLWLGQLLEDYALSLWPMVRVMPDDDAIVLLTAGAGRDPEEHVETHRSVARSGMQLRNWFASQSPDVSKA